MESTMEKEIASPSTPIESFDSLSMQESNNEEFVKIPFYGKHDCKVHPCISSAMLDLNDENEVIISMDSSEQAGIQESLIKIFPGLEPYQFVIQNNDDEEGSETNEDEHDEEGETSSIEVEERSEKRGRPNLKEDSFIEIEQSKAEISSSEKGDEEQEEEDEQEDGYCIHLAFPSFPNLLVEFDQCPELENGDIDLDELIREDSSNQRFFGKIVIEESTASIDPVLLDLYRKMLSTLEEGSSSHLVSTLKEFGPFKLSFFEVNQCSWKGETYLVPLFPCKWLMEGVQSSNFDYTRLQDVLIEEKEICLAFSFPFTKPMCLPLTSASGCLTRGQLMTEIAERYRKFYNKELTENKEEELRDKSEWMDVSYVPLYKLGFKLYSEMLDQMTEEEDLKPKKMNIVYFGGEDNDVSSTFQTSGDPGIFLLTDFVNLKIDHLEWYPKKKILVPRFDVTNLDLSSIQEYTQLIDIMTDFDIFISKA